MKNLLNIYKESNESYNEKWNKVYQQKKWTYPETNKDDITIEKFEDIIKKLQKNKIDPNAYEDFVGVVFIENGKIYIEIDEKKHELFSLEGDKIESLLAIIAKKKLSEG